MTPVSTTVFGLPRRFAYVLTMIWAVFGLGGWALVGCVVYWDSQKPIARATAPLVLQGCTTVKWLEPPVPHP